MFDIDLIALIVRYLRQGKYRFPLSLLHLCPERHGVVPVQTQKQLLQSHFPTKQVSQVLAVAVEALFATLEWELLDRSHFHSPEEAERAVFEFIEGWYNTRRRHSALHYDSPIEYESRYWGVAEDTSPELCTETGSLHGGSSSLCDRIVDTAHRVELKGESVRKPYAQRTKEPEVVKE